MKNYLDNTGLGTLWGLIKAKFATTAHTHKVADITDLTQIGKAGTGENAEIFNNHKSTTASGAYSHAEGVFTTASGDGSHTEGGGTVASGREAHAGGHSAVAGKNFTFAHGDCVEASSNDCEVAFGAFNKSNTDTLFSIGNGTDDTKKSNAFEITKTTGKLFDKEIATKEDSIGKAGTGMYAEIFNAYTQNEASGVYSHAEGLRTLASGKFAHAEGIRTTASGDASHAEGDGTTASGSHSHAEGCSTTALTAQHVIGHFNATRNAGSSITTVGAAFIIGNGSDSAVSNAFRVDYAGTVYATNATISTGADYAEYFEWADGNLDNEDRVGHFVTFDENNPKMLRIANSADDYILGIVSGMPSVIGNGDEDWKQRYVLDAFGRYIPETVTYVDEQGQEQTGTRWRQNPAYDSTQLYVPRAERKEWSAVGLLGVLSVCDDGTCLPGAYCTVTDKGLATAATAGYKVLRRVSETVVEVLFR